MPPNVQITEDELDHLWFRAQLLARVMKGERRRLLRRLASEAEDLARYCSGEGCSVITADEWEIADGLPCGRQ